VAFSKAISLALALVYSADLNSKILMDEKQLSGSKSRLDSAISIDMLNRRHAKS